jgi:hypothetical protein
MIEHIPLRKKNRMLRPFALGENDGRWFGRTDLWWMAFRFTGWALPLYLVAYAALIYRILS